MTTDHQAHGYEHHKRRSRRIIRSIQAKALRRRSMAEVLADTMTSYFGTVLFLVANIITFAVWIMVNTIGIPGWPVFDPYPFNFLTMAVSLEAIVLTTIVLMSQNRDTRIATLRDELQLQVMLITEREITKLLDLTKQMAEKNGLTVNDPVLTEMLSDIDTSYIERKITAELNQKS